MTPLGARALLGLPAGELASLDLEAAEILGPFAAELHERVRAAGTWADRFAVVDGLLFQADRSSAGRPAPDAPEVAYAWRALLASRGAMPIADLAQETGWSARHLGGRFRAEIGLTPKAAARVIRFDRARRLLQRRSSARAERLRWPIWPRRAATTTRPTWPVSSASWPGARRAAGWPRSSETSKPGARRGGRIAAMTDRTPAPQVWPTLRARDALGLIRFLVEAFGFEETVVYADGDQVHHAQLSWPPGGGIMLGSARPDADGDRWPVQPGSFGATSSPTTRTSCSPGPRRPARKS